MIYVEAIDKAKNMMAITNTQQGRTEWVSYDEVVTAVLDGVEVLGCLVGDDLQRTRRFRDVSCHAKMPPITVKIGDICRVSGGDTSSRNIGTICIILGIDFRWDNITFATITGQIDTLNNTRATFSAVKAKELPKRTKDILLRILQISKETNKITAEIRTLCAELKQLTGVLSEEEVFKAVKGKLPSSLSSALDRFKLKFWDNGQHILFKMECTRDIQERCNHVYHSFLEAGSDGDMYFVPDAETHAEYKRYLRSYQVKLPIEGVSWRESLDVGYNWTLFYRSCYTLEIPEEYRPYTQSTVDYIVKRLTAKTK